VTIGDVSHEANANATKRCKQAQRILERLDSFATARLVVSWLSLIGGCRQHKNKGLRPTFGPYLYLNGGSSCDTGERHTC